MPTYRITESQLRRIISEEIEALVETETAGEKAADVAAAAKSLSGFETAAAKVGDAKGVADLIMGAIKSSKLGGNLKTNSSKVKEALRLIINNYDEYLKQAETSQTETSST